MIEASNFNEVKQPRAYPGEPSPTAANATLPRQSKDEGLRYFETTNHYMFDRLPGDYNSRPPPPEQGDDKRFIGGYPGSKNPNVVGKGKVVSTTHLFHARKTLQRDSWNTETSVEPPRGSYGSRGELVRVPEEAGSLGTSSTIWADEYATLKRTAK